MKTSRKLSLAGLGLMVIALDVAAAIVVGTVAMDAVRERDASVVANAGRTVARRIASTLESQATRMAGEGLIALARGASRVYRAMLSVTPEAEARVAGSAPACRAAVVRAVAGAPEAAGDVPSCRKDLEILSPAPARWYSQTL